MSPKETDAQISKFAATVEVSSISQSRGYTFEIVPDQDELDAIAQGLDVPTIRKMRFKGELQYDEQGDLVLTGQLGATVTQNCVVSLEPVKTRIDTDVARKYLKDYPEHEDDRQMLEDEDENVDPLKHHIDLGLVATEEIALNLPDFPRAPDAELADSTFAPPGIKPMSDDDAKPFAKLAGLKEQLASKDQKPN